LDVNRLVKAIFLPEELDEFRVYVPLAEVRTEMEFHGVAGGHVHDEESDRGDPEKEWNGLEEPL
jgi:hypothetical protein